MYLHLLEIVVAQVGAFPQTALPRNDGDNDDRGDVYHDDGEDNDGDCDDDGDGTWPWLVSVLPLFSLLVFSSSYYLITWTKQNCACLCVYSVHDSTTTTTTTTCTHLLRLYERYRTKPQQRMQKLPQKCEPASRGWEYHIVHLNLTSP